MVDVNGRMKISWPQFVWGAALMVIVISTWKDLRWGLDTAIIRLVRIEAVINDTYTKRDVDAMKSAADLKHAEFDLRLKRIEHRLGID